MLDANMKNQLGQYLANLQSEVEVIVALDDSAKAKEVDSLVNDIVELSAKVTRIDYDGDNLRRPSMVIRSVAKNTKIAFAGVPMGHEFTSLVFSLVAQWWPPDEAGT